jgi:hypothetical protein
MEPHHYIQWIAGRPFETWLSFEPIEGEFGVKATVKMRPAQVPADFTALSLNPPPDMEDTTTPPPPGDRGDKE